MKQVFLVVTIFCVLSIIINGLAYKVRSAEVPAPTPTPHIFSQERLTQLVNQYRIDHNLQSFIYDPKLCTYAEERVVEIQTDWSHDQFLADRCSKTPYNYCAENLARGYLTEQDVLNAWDKSPKHHENLVSDYTYMCISCSDGYCAQEWGK